MTNVDHQAVRALYEVLHGFELEVVERKCVISSQLKARCVYSELIVTANMQ